MGAPLTTTSSLSSVIVSEKEAFPSSTSNEVIFEKTDWNEPVTFFVGRNGTGKSRVARAVARKLDGRLLVADRLVSFTSNRSVGSIYAPSSEHYRGLPLGDEYRDSRARTSRELGLAHDELYALREQPEVWLRVAAFIKRALHRDISLRESAGLLDPFITMGSVQYSLLRDEGHGLRELTILLTVAFREDWKLLVVDEPELHLHPSMARLWLGELERVCRSGDRRAIIVTHEPSLVRPTKSNDLRSLYYFGTGRPFTPVYEHIRPGDGDRVTATLSANPELVSKLVFSPRPVLVEGTTDVAGLTVALNRTQLPETVAQTDLVQCGGSGGVALWFEIARTAGIDVRAIGDLDASLAPEVQRVMDRSEAVLARYRKDFALEPPSTHAVVRPLIEAMNANGVSSSPKDRSRWLANDVPSGTGWAERKKKLLEIWRDAGLWLHSEGTLEDVLGGVAKSRDSIIEVAATPGAIDNVAQWCAYDVDLRGDVEILLGLRVESIAHGIMRAIKLNPSVVVAGPVGSNAEIDSRLVDIRHEGAGEYLMTIKKPREFAGYWVRFSRDTPSTALGLMPPASHE